MTAAPSPSPTGADQSQDLNEWAATLPPGRHRLRGDYRADTPVLVDRPGVDLWFGHATLGRTDTPQERNCPHLILGPRFVGSRIRTPGIVGPNPTGRYDVTREAQHGLVLRGCTDSLILAGPPIFGTWGDGLYVTDGDALVESESDVPVSAKEALASGVDLAGLGRSNFPAVAATATIDGATTNRTDERPPARASGSQSGVARRPPTFRCRIGSPRAPLTLARNGRQGAGITGAQSCTFHLDVDSPGRTYVDCEPNPKVHTGVYDCRFSVTVRGDSALPGAGIAFAATAQDAADRNVIARLVGVDREARIVLNRAGHWTLDHARATRVNTPAVTVDASSLLVCADVYLPVAGPDGRAPKGVSSGIVLRNGGTVVVQPGASFGAVPAVARAAA